MRSQDDRTGLAGGDRFPNECLGPSIGCDSSAVFTFEQRDADIERHGDVSTTRIGDGCLGSHLGHAVRDATNLRNNSEDLQIGKRRCVRFDQAVVGCGAFADFVLGIDQRREFARTDGAVDPCSRDGEVDNHGLSDTQAGDAPIGKRQAPVRAETHGGWVGGATSNVRDGDTDGPCDRVVRTAHLARIDIHHRKVRERNRDRSHAQRVVDPAALANRVVVVDLDQDRDLTHRAHVNRSSEIDCPHIRAALGSKRQVVERPGKGIQFPS